MIRKVLLSVTVLMVCAMLVSVAMAYDVPDNIVIDRPEDNKKVNTWVTEVKFLHGFHAIRLSCNSCHHKESDKTLGQFVACRQCHSSDDPNDKTGFYRAWHSDGPPSCLGCHTRMRTQGGKNPVGCTTACHKPS